MAKQLDQVRTPAWVRNGRGGPFDLDADAAYRRWRDTKLEHYPRSVDELVVEVSDPRRLSRGEKARIIELCRRANMALYASPLGENPDKAIPRELGRQLGLTRLDSNLCADDDGITSLTVVQDGGHSRYIPYTDRPIHWHTDGYYNDPRRQIQGLLLHCVRPALRGGENALLDFEAAYILTRDKNPDYIRALMDPAAMTVLANVRDGRVIRPTRVGPVFSVTRDGRLHMRYTRRTRNIRWKNDPVTRRAVAFLESLLDDDSPYVFRATLQPGQGLISNNVLHDRSGFEGAAPAGRGRLLYRARYYERIAGT